MQLGAEQNVAKWWIERGRQTTREEKEISRQYKTYFEAGKPYTKFVTKKMLGQLVEITYKISLKD